MLTPYRLHYAPDNASLVIRLAMEEMGVTYETVLVDRRRNEQDSAAYRALNPNGLIPVLETPQGPIFETAAILLWLSEHHGQLAPAPGDPARAEFLKWLFFASNTLHADLRILFYAEKYIDPSQADTLRTGIRPRLRRHLQLLDTVAKRAPDWFCADQPSVLTYYVACMMRWMALYPAQADRSWYQLADTPCLQTMLAHLETRPATRSAIAAEGLGATPFTSPVHANPPEGSAI
ncbi:MULTISPECIES: glutathione S-transferase family protein [unclassified Ruegeria]|uniref:glutathione S-transferase family protein n=1 Tax=unclassified Ruegeria TaxID=2625375 RepID=UPI0014880188|nr:MULTISPECIES: glutathione S-transferase family protein [unclassified Ruegeria]NOD86986.1 glutathione S-transferase [Ruegeria sp. HKCCD4318]NOE12541.1 glutathione S-transferase [Ruegeria sp. HKCCD4318-2]NOG09294.1 glutathione S-transferase family protein [Ruegeria sp. HKCCD4315]